MSTTFALVEDGTSRVLLFLPDDLSCIRTLEGVWRADWAGPSEVVMPDELGDFRAASTSELSALLQEAVASLTLTPSLACAALNAAPYPFTAAHSSDDTSLLGAGPDP